MQRVLIASLLFAMALFVAGCGVNLEKAVVGKFRGEIDISGVDAKEKAAAEMGATMLKGFTFDIKEGGKATMTGMGMNEEGTWKLEGTKLTITNKSGKPQTFNVEDGGKKLVPEMTAEEAKVFQGAKIWFKKE